MRPGAVFQPAAIAQCAVLVGARAVARAQRTAVLSTVVDEARIIREVCGRAFPDDGRAARVRPPRPLSLCPSSAHLEIKD